MLGKIKKQQLTNKYGKGKIPTYFNPDKLPKIDDTQVVWFNDMHMKQKAGLNMHANMQIRFKKDSEGRFDDEKGTLAPAASSPTFKYSQEARFCLGVAKVKY